MKVLHDTVRLQSFFKTTCKLKNLGPQQRWMPCLPRSARASWRSSWRWMPCLLARRRAPLRKRRGPHSLLVSGAVVAVDLIAALVDADVGHVPVPSSVELFHLVLLDLSHLHKRKLTTASDSRPRQKAASGDKKSATESYGAFAWLAEATVLSTRPNPAGKIRRAAPCHRQTCTRCRRAS